MQINSKDHSDSGEDASLSAGRSSTGRSCHTNVTTFPHGDWLGRLDKLYLKSIPDITRGSNRRYSALVGPRMIRRVICKAAAGQFWHQDSAQTMFTVIASLRSNRITNLALCRLRGRGSQLHQRPGGSQQQAAVLQEALPGAHSCSRSLAAALSYIPRRISQHERLW